MGRASLFCLLVLALALGTACRASRYTVPPGEQLARLDDVGLSVDVTGLKNARRMLSLWCEIANAGPSSLRFARADVVLTVEGRSYPARDVEALDFVVELAPGQVLGKVWGFHVGRALKHGTYEIRISNIAALDDGVRQTTDRELVVPVTIPRGF